MGEAFITRRGVSGEIDFTKVKGYFSGTIGSTGITFSYNGGYLNIFDYRYILVWREYEKSVSGSEIVFLKIDKANETVETQAIERYTGPIGSFNVLPRVKFRCEYASATKKWILNGKMPAGQVNIDVYAVLIP